MDIIFIVFDCLLVLRLLTSSVMCVYSCKWRKGLIALSSLYIGIILGILFLCFLIEIDFPSMEAALIVSAIVPIIFLIMAYKWIWLNHFLTGFLVTNKLLFMIIYRLMSEDIIDAEFEVLMIVPIVVGIIVGLIISKLFVNVAVLFCIVYIGSVDLVLTVSEIIKKGLFVATADISYIFDPEDIILKFIGVEIPSAIEVILIIGIGIVSFIWQAKILRKRGISLSDYIIDDRKNALLE